MQRELFAMEEWIYRAARRKHTPLPINFGIALACDPLPSPSRLQEAIEDLTASFPLTAARVILRTPQKAILTTEGTLPLPITSRDVPHPWEAIASELPRPFDDPMRPLIRLFLYHTPEGDFLFAHFDHALVDGIGAITWLRHLFLRLEGETPPPPPILDLAQVMQAHAHGSWETQYATNAPRKTSWWTLWREKLHEPRWPERLHYRILTYDCDPSLTEKIRQAAHQNQTSVHAMLSVSFLEAFYESGYGHKRPQRVVLSPVNLRRRYHLPPESYGLFNGTLRTTVDFSQPMSFWERCRLFKRELDVQFYQTDFLYDHYRAERDLARALAYGFAQRRRFDTRHDYDLSLSNIGVVSGFPPSVKRIYGPIAQGLPTETVLGVCTLENTMTLSWVSKPEYLPDEKSASLFQRGLEILFSHLEEQRPFG